MKNTGKVWAVLLDNFRVATIEVDEAGLSVLALFSTKKKATEMLMRLEKQQKGLRLARIELIFRN
jgi:hypothetical protein